MPSSFVPFLLYSSAVAGASAYVYNNEELLALVLSQPQNYLYAGVALIAIIGFILLPSFVDEGRVGGVTGLLQTKGKNEVDTKADEYFALFGSDSRKGGKEHEALVTERQKNYTTVANHLYDLVTDFYEYGWGQSFHFANRFVGETFAESIRRAEYYLALRLKLTPGQKVADVGCGVGGPLRNIAKFSGAHVTGINNNQYQLNIAERYNKAEGLADQTAVLKCDFMNIPVPDATFDAAYEIEATCHAPDKVGCYSEICRILKPGGYFAGYEWCVTPSYDPKNPRHVAIKQGIEVGNGLPTLATYEEVNDALVKAGFELVEAFNPHDDAHKPTNIPWYDSLDGKRLSNFRMTRTGRFFTHLFVNTLEFLRIAPKGSAKVSAMLNATALDLVDGGRLDVFTPDYFFVVRKPLKK